MATGTVYSDQELVRLLGKGDKIAYTEIYNRYWKKLLAIAYHHTKDKSAAEEIVQEVLISLWDRRTALHIEVLEYYLATAIKFAVFKSYTRKRRHDEIAQYYYTESTESAEEVPEEMIEARFLKEYIDGVVEQLPEKCRLVFKYSRNEYKSNLEIAEELSISEKAVEAHITRAIKHLRGTLRRAGLFTLVVLVLFG